MTPAKPAQMISTMTTRQKVTAAIFVVIVLFLLYQIWGLFGGGSSAPTAPVQPGAMSSTAPGAMLPQQLTPQPAELPKQQSQAALSQREADLVKLQQETESKYISAINELQMLRIEREIAETNKAIMAAKLDTVTAEKSIVDLLKPPPPITTGNYAQSLVSPVSSGTGILQQPGQLPPQPPQQQAQPVQPVATMQPPTPVVSTPEVNYTVISVSQLQNKWNAVVGFQGNLYNVYIGDVLPPDQSKVVTIDKTGVVLEKNGMRKKVSMVPII